jgi:hypothetical protein
MKELTELVTEDAGPHCMMFKKSLDVSKPQPRRPAKEAKLEVCCIT